MTTAFHHHDSKEEHHYHHHHHHHHHAVASHHGKGHLPIIPDLRFESSYIRSVRRYVEVERVESAPDELDQALRAHLETLDVSVDEKGNVQVVEKEEEFMESAGAVVRAGPREVIHVQWKSVIWVTMRDQVISPLVQGVLWALASYYITPFSSQIGSRMGTFVHNSIPTKEGRGVTWLRNWAKNIGFSNSNNVNSPPPRTTTSSNYNY